jgi:hypothetical protein
MRKAFMGAALLLAMVSFTAQNASAAGALVELSGVWTLQFSNGNTGTLVLTNVGGAGGTNSPVYTGKLTLPGFGEWNVYGIQVPDYYRVGNAMNISVGDPTATKWVSCTITGTNAMPGKLIGTGWIQDLVRSPYNVPFTATRG